MQRISSSALVVTLASTPTWAGAQPVTAFDNLSPGGGYFTDISWVVNGPDVEYAEERITHGMRFTAERSGRVERIDLAIGLITGTNAARVQLWTADENGLMGERLATWVVEGAVPEWGLNFEATPFESFGAGPSISAGSDYWIVPVATLDTDFGWYWTEDDTLTAPMVNIRPGGVRNYFTDRQGAARVVVPGPGGIGALGLCLAMTGRVRSRR
ncbi:MAG: hypothetical protein ACF8Q5_00150 [Phycisphaerales bacterium JB040]